MSGMRLSPAGTGPDVNHEPTTDLVELTVDSLASYRLTKLIRDDFIFDEMLTTTLLRAVGIRASSTHVPFAGSSS